MSFGVIVLSPPATVDPSVAIAASRAGAVGVLDLEFATDIDAALAGLATLVRLGRSTRGVRVASADPSVVQAVLAQLRPECTTLVATVPALRAFASEIAAVRERGLRLIVEVTEAAAVHVAEQAQPDALIARGLEAGGWGGDETTFILLQRLLADTRLPVWAHGGIGLHSAAAAVAAGAAGVVLDLQLALMREASLPAGVQAALGRMDGGETVRLGEELGRGFRVFARPGVRALDDVRRRAETLQEAAVTSEARLEMWEAEVRPRVGWKHGDLWPVGQDAAFAASLARRFVTVGAAVQGLRAAIEEHLALARRLRPLAAGSPLATSHGTRYPILQGPMTRVSDVPAFAEAVAAEGGLPFLALALLRAQETRRLLEETGRRLGARPWGVGILGFVPIELRNEQLGAIREARPAFAIIAGGRPDQAASLEAEGIATYLHVPSPALLRMFVEGGARRFIFEGRECGGHVGPRSSLVLWNSMVEVLLETLPPEAAADCHVVFAGGIHDARSGAAVAALAAPLAERGVKVGVLLGTGYLFTREAVASGAIVEAFQAEAVRCSTTALLETAPGHSTRCAVTSFVDTFQQERRRLHVEGRAPDAIRDALEELNLGRLRIATKGLRRGQDGLVTVPRDEQLHEGMYMIGQVATLRDRICTIAEFHDEVTDGATRLLGEPAPVLPAALEDRPRPADIAIVGMACFMPKANSLEAYWTNVLNKVDAITEIPEDRFDWRRYYDPDPSAPDKIVSKWGGFLDPVAFDAARYGMPPSSLPSIEPLQLLTLEAARRALEDAGYTARPFPRARTGVVVGVGGGVAELGQRYAFRSSLPTYLTDVPAGVWEQLPEWTEDSFAGIILNVAAGRVANRFDLGGANYTVDAACASSLAALYAGVRELESGTADMMIAAAADTVQNPFGYLCFSKTRALSPRGRCRTFDDGADGIVIGEGIAVVVLKRLADAERDGDRIYAVIKAVAGSSDGRDRSMTAPRPEGQMLALRRAYATAGLSPATVELVEAHGTGTVAGDQAEIEALTRVFMAAGSRPHSCAVGSVKSMIGHTKCAAGLAGLIKVAKALHHRVLPPTIGVERPNSRAGFGEGPLYVNSEARPWLRYDDEPRRAGVSSFGFGGTNFHAVVEEYTGTLPSAPVPAAHAAWPAELFLFAGRGTTELVAAIDVATSAAVADTPLRRLAAEAWERARTARVTDTLTLAVVATTLDDLRAKLVGARARLTGGAEAIEDLRGVYFSASPLGREGGVAFLFPGQGSQYPDMLRELAVCFPEVRARFESASRRLRDCFPHPLGAYVFPPPPFTAEEATAQEQALRQTNVAQPALGAADLAMLALLEAFGLHAAAVAGHSYGEYVALCAAGALTEDDLYSLSEARGRAIVEGAGPEPGTMAAVQASTEQVAQALDGTPEVWIANINGPRQTVISGTRGGIQRAVQQLEARGLRAREVAVACAFHSPVIAGASTRFAEHLLGVQFAPPTIAVYSNVDAAPYDPAPAAIVGSLREHLTRPVRFLDEIQAMYEAGSRIFVEVGPRNILTALVQQTLEGRRCLAVATDVASRPGITQLLHALAQLSAHGVTLSLDRLFQGRLEGLEPAPAPSATTWLVSGGCSRPLGAAAAPRPGPAQAAAPATSAAARIETTSPAPTAPLVRRELPVATGRSLPDPVVQSASSLQPAAAAAPGPSPSAAAMLPAASSDADADVMVQFQRTMERFLETQRNVMLAYLGAAGDGPAPPVPLAAAASTAASVEPRAVVERRRYPRVPAALAVRIVTAGAERLGAAVDLAPEGMKLQVGAPVVEGSQVTLRFTPPDGGPSLSLLSVLVRTDADGQAFYFVSAAPADVARLERLTRPGALPEPVLAPARSEAPGEGEPAGVARPTAGAGADAAWLRGMLQRVTSERTGYPVEMLDLDAGMEADLGIDSIKRVEILGALSKVLPATLAERLQGQMETLTRARTLRNVADTVCGALFEAAAPATTNGHAIAPAGEPPHDAGWVRDELLRVVGERTGYPSEMLDLDAGMEADLGIDSIKRVEILGSFRARVPAEIAEPLQAQMEVLTRARTLRNMIDTLCGVLAADATIAAGNGPMALTPPGPPPVDAAWVRDALLDIVSERTGYPPEMVDLEVGMEADLGIDSIKRVEILGAFRKALPATAGERVQGQIEVLTRARTLRNVIDTVAGLLAEPTPVEPASALLPPAAVAGPLVPATRNAAHTAAAGEPARAGELAPLPRCVPITVERPLSGTPAALPGGPGVVVITADGLGVAARLRHRLLDRGLRAVIVGDGVGVEEAGSEWYRVRLDEEGAVAELVRAIRERHGPAVGLVHLAPLVGAGMAEIDVDGWRARTRREVKGLYRLLVALGEDLCGTRGSFVLGVTGLGGSFGCDGLSPDVHPGSGGVVGLVKTLAVEWPGTRCHVVDLDPTEATEALCAAVLAEITADDGEVEVGWTRHRRLAVRLRSAMHQEDAAAELLGPASVVLVTGGARGITGEVAEEMAPHCSTMILVGRHALPERPEAEATAGLEAPADLKRALIAALSVDGRRPLLGEVESAYQALLRDREVRRRVAAITAAGATVVYRAVDVRDAAALASLVGEIYATYGRLDGVVHGAGVIEDRLLLDKTPDSFDRVFDTKVDGAFALARALRPESLRFLAFFSSVAGRFANRGQADYVAANEVLNKLARWLDARWHSRVVALNWGPWAGSGMVSEVVAQQFTERGVGLVRPEQGRRAFLAELTEGAKGAAEVVLGAGPWERQAAEQAGPPLDFPLFNGTPLRLVAGGAIEARRTLDPAEDLYLGDHRLNGKPVLPAAVAAELMAECVQKAWPDWRLVGLRNFQLLRGVVLQADRTSVRIVAQAPTPAPEAVDRLEVDVAMFEGNAAKPSYRATADLAREALEPMMIDLPAPSTLAPFPLSPERAYDEWLFHGPRFQCLTSIDGIGEWELLATVRPSRPADCVRAPGADPWLMDPIVVDSGLQLVLLLTRAKWDVSGLPAAFEALRIFGPLQGEALRCYLRMRPGSDEHGARSDIYFTTLAGRVLVALEGFESSSSRALNRLMGAAGRGVQR